MGRFEERAPIVRCSDENRPSGRLDRRTRRVRGATPLGAVASTPGVAGAASAPLPRWAAGGPKRGKGRVWEGRPPIRLRPWRKRHQAGTALALSLPQRR